MTVYEQGYHSRDNKVHATALYLSSTLAGSKLMGIVQQTVHFWAWEYLCHLYLESLPTLWWLHNKHTSRTLGPTNKNCAQQLSLKQVISQLTQGYQNCMYFVHVGSLAAIQMCFTLTDHSSIFTMATVILFKVMVLTLVDKVFLSTACHFIQPNAACSKTKADEKRITMMHTVDNVWMPCKSFLKMTISEKSTPSSF